MHFPIVSFAPVVSAQAAYNEKMNVAQITGSAFESANQML
jgi:tubulin alpha